MKKWFWIVGGFIIVAITILLIVYNSQEHVILSKKFNLPIKRDMVVYSEKQTGTSAYYYAKLRVDEERYSKFLNDMKDADYFIDSMDFNYGGSPVLFGIPSENIDSVYSMDSSKYVFPVSVYPVHCYIYISLPIDGFRELYIVRNN